MNDTRAGFPESHIVLRGGGSQKVVNLFVDIDSTLQIGDSANLSLNQVVTVDSGGDSSAIHPGRHELQDSHLSGGILASNSVWAELKIADTSSDVLTMGVSQMTIENLLGQGEGAF